MPLTTAQKAKLIIEIKKLIKKANQLERRARNEDESFLESAKTYGSELAGSSGTEHMHKEVKSLREKAKFFESVNNGNISLSDKQKALTRLGEIQQEIRSFEIEKSVLENRLEHFRRLQKILSS